MQISAGLLMYVCKPEFRLLLGHPGGPYFKNKDNGSWTIPKGAIEGEEDLISAARREFEEETGISVMGALRDLSFVRLKSGKKVYCWAFEGDESKMETFKSNTFEMEWPPKSGKKAVFAEIDKIGLFSLGEAKDKIMEAQIPFLERLEALITKKNI